MRAILLLPLCLVLLLGCRSTTKVTSSPTPAFLSEMRQLTFEGRRAGEGYFSRDGRQLIFQSERESQNPFYQIYLLDLESGTTKRVSPGQGKTSCAWIHPNGKKVMFASTHTDPELKTKAEAEWAERKNPTKRYNWSFDDTYDLYEADTSGKNLKALTKAKGYDAEGSYSPDGQWIAFASNRAAFSEKLDPETAKTFARDPSYMMDIYIMRADGSQVKRLTSTRGYDGGPFFSPDGKRLTFRRFSEDGHSAEIYTMNVDGSDQKQITRLKAMSWAPFYHPSGDYLIFATNVQGFNNFELYIVDVAGQKEPVRASDLANFDGLPVFSPDGQNLVWTHSNEKGEAQLYRAKWNDALARQALGLSPAANKVDGLSTEISTTDAQKWVEYLASERFGGRPTGGPSEAEYTARLVEAFKQMGLSASIEKYEFTSGIELRDKNQLQWQANGKTETAVLAQDWIPLSYSKVGDFGSGPLIFAGYGIVAPATGNQAAYNSYEGLDSKGKWVLVFAGLPDDIANERRFHLHLYSRLQHKAMMARQNGALGLVVIEDSKTPSAPLKLSFEGRSEDAGLPVVRLSPAMADQIFALAGSSRAVWTKNLGRGEIQAPPVLPVTLKAAVDLHFKKSPAVNVIARLSAPKARTSVMIGAHLDHLGLGEGGNSLSKVPGVIHYGADDNASGVAGVLEIAQSLSERLKRGEIKLKQNVDFALWTGEEIGVLGSSSYLKNKRPISSYLNMDMIGRLQNELIVQGVASAPQWKSLIERVNMKSPLKITTQDDPYLPTDAMSFYLKQIPTISVFTGSHPQYHTGEDKPALINYTGLVQTAQWVEEMTVLLASADPSLVTYQKVEGSKNLDRGRGFRLYLGTIPDYSQEGKQGVLISGTSKGSPAETAGLKPGDIIVELGGMKIQNLNDYVYCLQALKANEKIKMRVVRANQEKELDIVPALKNP